MIEREDGFGGELHVGAQRDADAVLRHARTVACAEEAAREGLARLGGSPPGMSLADAVDGPATVCLLDSTLYLRNQLLRDSDWASMAHSLELRTPLVDATLLEALKSCHTAFAGGAGKRMLAHSPLNPLPEAIVARRKSGFAVPMTAWLSAATDRRDWESSPLFAGRGTPWTRRWASRVIEGFAQSATLAPLAVS